MVSIVAMYLKRPHVCTRTAGASAVARAPVSGIAKHKRHIEVIIIIWHLWVTNIIACTVVCVVVIVCGLSLEVGCISYDLR